MSARSFFCQKELHNFLKKTNLTPKTVIINNGIADQTQSIHHSDVKMDLYSTIIGAISLPFQPLAASAATNHEVYTSLIFRIPTRGHIKQLKYQVKSCVKSTKTISEYMRLIKSTSDELTLLIKPIDAEDLIEQIQDGLPEMAETT